MNKISLIYSYYNCPQVIPLLVKNWLSWSNEAKENVTIILIDDGSRKKFYDEFKKFHTEGLHIEMYEIIPDIRWNQPGAFNLGISQAKTPWVMIMPVDRLIPQETIHKMIHYPLNENNLYLIKDIVNGKEVGRPPGIFLLAKKAFMDCGMFDEDFCGNYGYDDAMFRRKFSEKFRETNTDWHLEVLPHASHEHKLIRDTETNKQLLNDKLSGKTPASTNYLRFQWKKI